MTATEYAKQFENFPTYHKIAMDAFKAGLENAKTPNIQKLEKDLKEAKKELKHLWNTLEDPVIMKVDIECHKCKKEFEAEWDVRGKCPHCENKYDWAWDGEIWSETETCLPIFESESEGVKNSFLLVRDWV